MRIYIDCTDTYHSHSNSGIQRVVRNIINNAPFISEDLGVECTPVVLDKGHYYAIGQLHYGYDTRAIARIRRQLNDLYLGMIRKIIKFLPFPRLTKFLTASKHDFGLTRLILCFSYPLTAIFKKNPKNESKIGNGANIKFVNGDLLVLADAIWNYNFWASAHEARKQGASIIAVIYDIIPLSHPHLVGQKHKLDFEYCLNKLYHCVDGFIGISDFTKATLIQYLATQDYASDHLQKKYNFFHLGAELDAVNKKDGINLAMKKILNPTASTYLMVGTIEPRKNHLYAIEAFNMLWEHGVDVNLVIIGKPGWLCDGILSSIRTHRMFRKKLFLFNFVSDSELEYGYSHAKALLFPAIIEGFGLPLIEAQKKGLPVFASDIPVFREVAGDSAAYFDNTKPQSLAKMLIEYEKTGVFPAKGPAGFTWPSWKESTRQLLLKLIAMANEIHGTYDVDHTIKMP